MLATSSCENKAAKKMPSYFKEEEIHGHAEGERLVVETGASSVAQNETDLPPQPKVLEAG
jgi:hypothetical protein